MSPVTITIFSIFLAVNRAFGSDPCGPSNQPSTYSWNSCTDVVNRSSPNAPGPYSVFWDSDPQFVFPQNCTNTNQIMIEPWPIQDNENPGHPAPEVDVLCAGMVSQNISNSWVFARYIDLNAQAGEVGLYIPGGAGTAPMISYDQCQRNLFKVMSIVGTQYTNRASVNLVPGGFPMSTYGANKPIGSFSTGQQVDAGYPSYLARA